MAARRARSKSKSTSPAGGTGGKGSVRATREASSLRRFLTLLADSDAVAKPNAKSIDTVSSEWGIHADRLRDFRDGTAESLDRATVTILNKLLGRDDHGMLGVNMDEVMGFADPFGGGWYGAMLAEETQRQARLRMYQLIDRTRPEAHSALHCWADLAITGNITDSGKYGGGFEPVAPDASQAAVELLKRIESNVNGRLMPDDKKLQAFRGMAKYGDQFGELGIVERGGRYDIDRIYPRHPRTMYVARGPDGVSYDPSYAYKQMLPGRTEPVAKFPEWKIAHFANTESWGDVYGTSIFDPCMRSYLQVEAMESGMIIRRLERASQRYKHIVDVGLVDGGDDALRKFQREYRNLHRKALTVDGSKNFKMQKISMPPGEDFYIWKRDKDSPADIDILKGDEYIEQIGDVMHFWKKWLSGLGPPSSHLGYDDAASKTGVNDKHIVFARKVRRMQLKFVSGLNHIYWVSLMLRGVDPRTVRFTIFPPSMGTRDELIQAQMQLARATTVQYLGAAFAQTGEMPSIPWFLRYVMNYDDGVIDKLQLKKVIPKGSGSPGFKNAPPKNVKDKRNEREREMARHVQDIPAVQEQVRVLDFMLEERAIALKLPEAADGVRRMIQPAWAADFDSVARSMGIKELRAA